MRAKSIMVVGTMSSAGKSVVTAGLCRMFHQDGYRVAPFKSQNMALNSYITKDGLEMGRAQVMQAEAAGIAADIGMNPILLKPTSEAGSQVIVNGKVYDNLRAKEYYQRKQELIPEIRTAYESLAEEYDIVVLEGAGSPAEINLRDVDIVNMGMAAISDSPVIVVGDIDRGGVFASLYGTIALLRPEERRRIQGIIINKFRGDVKILEPGLRMIEERTGIPMVGVVPMEHLDIDDEDSLSDRLNQTQKGAGIDVAVIHLPHISNFTDFSAFERMDGVSLRYVSQPGMLGDPDLILLPGTKNTMDDCQWLRESGMEALILRQAEKKTPIIGICGGFQLLGEQMEDPHNVEHGGTMRGMGLLNTRTVFSEAKTRTQIRGVMEKGVGLWSNWQGKEVTGYEIHMGVTENLGGCQELVRLEDGRVDALANEDGSVMGSYLHGIFDTDGFAEEMIRRLMKEKGMEFENWHFDLEAHKEQEYDKLADLVRSSFDMKKIYEILEEGI